jgi:hypothetical protein
MAELYPPSYPRYPKQESYSPYYPPHPLYSSHLVPSNAPPVSTHSTANTSPTSDDPNDLPPHTPPHSSHGLASGSPGAKIDAKPQATFLTKLYALLERTENHHMIRWDPQGEHIIVERPEQLAQHVLPSVYRQSRFASFSRQLNIYGFMRKVNLRNVDPAIDDPDASTWSHPTLNRNSPPDLVANFKRRVPPRMPKTRKRDTVDALSMTPRSAVTSSNPSLPASALSHKNAIVGRARGFSAPGSFSPMANGNSAWGQAAGGVNSYDRHHHLPPLTVPDGSQSQGGLYNGSSHSLHHTDSPTSSQYGHQLPHYSGSSNLSSGGYAYPGDHGSWSSQSQSHSNGASLSSLLNPSSGHTRPTPTINTSYVSPFSALPLPAEHSASSLSPDSRPPTGYSSGSCMQYDDQMHDYSRPGSAHHRPASPARAHSSSKIGYNSLRVGRSRGHSQVSNPYPKLYNVDHSDSARTSTSPPVDHDDHSGNANNIPRVRSMIQLPSVDQYQFADGSAAGAGAHQTHSQPTDYSSYPLDVGHGHGPDGWNSNNRPIRSSTSTSSMSAASHTSSSQAHTPDSYATPGEADVHRYSPDYGYVAMNEHLPPQYSKPAGNL